jgi:hypothetical protein
MGILEIDLTGQNLVSGFEDWHNGLSKGHRRPVNATISTRVHDASPAKVEVVQAHAPDVSTRTPTRHRCVVVDVLGLKQDVPIASKDRSYIL